MRVSDDAPLDGPGDPVAVALPDEPGAVPIVVSLPDEPTAPGVAMPEEPRDFADALLTVTEVGRALRVSNMTVYRLIRRGDLAALRIGGNFRVPSSAFQAFLDTRKTS